MPIVSADIPEFCEMAEYEGMAMSFYKTGDVASFCEKVIALLQSPAAGTIEGSKKRRVGAGMYVSPRPRIAHFACSGLRLNGGFHL